MKKIIIVHIENLRKMISGKKFVIAILATLVLFVFANIYYDQISGKEYSLFSFYIQENSKELICDIGLNWDEIFLGESKGYIWLFAPIVVSIPYISEISNGTKNSNHRLDLVRSGKRAYIIGKFTASISIAGMIMCIAYFMYGTLLYILLLKLNQTHIIQSDYADIILKLLSMYVYGVISIIPTFILSNIFNNKYIVACIPLMINYFYVMFFSQIDLSYISSNRIGALFVKYFVPTNMQLVFLGDIKEIWVGMIMCLLLCIIAVVLFKISLERRIDCGEK